MTIKNTANSYGLVTRLLHWIIAISIIGLLWLGWWMVDLTYYDTWYHDSLLTHKSAGMLVLLLAVLNIVWLLVNKRPAFLANMKQWEIFSATLAHYTLLLAMITIPVTGYIISTSAGDSVSFFEWFPIPSVFAVSETTRDWAISLHYYLAYGTAALVIVHAGAACKHHFVNKDTTLRRMLRK